MMILYLIRHAHADWIPGEGRPLSAPVHQAAELGRALFFGDGRRVAHIYEQHGQLDLRTAWEPG